MYITELLLVYCYTDLVIDEQLCVHVYFYLCLVSKKLLSVVFWTVP